MSNGTITSLTILCSNIILWYNVIAPGKGKSLEFLPTLTLIEVLAKAGEIVVKLNWEVSISQSLEWT